MTAAKKIRGDFEGVVYVDGKALKAGDEVPEGVDVGDHLFDPPKQSAKKSAESDK